MSGEFNRRWKPGDALKASRLEGMRTMLQRIRGGAGIRVQNVAGNLLITLTRPDVAHRWDGNKNIRTVEVLPAVPGGGSDKVFWTSSGAGTGDDQFWEVHSTQSAWTPTQKRTVLSGVPV